MGCTNSTKKQETEVERRKPNENGFKNLFYATSEFDISTSESENEDEILSVKSVNNKQNLTKKINEMSSGLTTTNKTSSTASSTLLDNRLTQTCLVVMGHFIQQNDIDDLSMSEIKFDLKDSNVNDNVTYYSYHIHVYFLQRNFQQRNEAIVLRNRFLDEFDVKDCDNQCDTWCPRICHWHLNMSPVGPHPVGSWGVYIPLENFIQTVSFISMYHGNLTVLVHPNSGRPKIDHLLNAFWMKSILPLNRNQLVDSAPLPSH